MADKQISDLTAATQILPPDLFLLEQDGTAKKLTGQLLVNWMTSYADGHGGIQRIAKTSTSGLVDTYTITYADASTSTFTVTNGAKGDTGAAWYIHIKYASERPESNADMGDDPDNWIGIYSGTDPSPSPLFTDYTWFKIKGETGDPADLLSSSVLYQGSTNGTVPPTGQWSTTIPIVSPGNYLWSRTILTFNSGLPVYVYAAARQGVNGNGAPSDEIPLDDVSGGSAGTSPAFSRADHQHPTPILEVSATLTALPATIQNADVKSTMHVIYMSFGTPGVMTSDVAWSTADGSIELSGTMSGTTTVDIVLAIT